MALAELASFGPEHISRRRAQKLAIMRLWRSFRLGEQIKRGARKRIDAPKAIPSGSLGRSTEKKEAFAAGVSGIQN